MKKRLTIKDLSYERLHELLHYDPKTGDFIRKKAVGRHGRHRKGSIAGTMGDDGYMRISIDGKLYKSSRLAFLYMLGYFPEHEAEHKDRVRDNDKWDNLREATHSCNMRNCGISKNNKSGIVGVHWDKSRNKWVVKIYCNKKHNHIGRFNSLLNAAKARWEAEKKYGFPNCNTTSSAYKYLKERT